MTPQVAVIIPTKDRPADLLRCVQSVLACDYPLFEILVVDQSPADLVPNGAMPLPDDDRIRYFRSTIPGKCLALNNALRQTTAEILLFTDDDCTVPHGWIARHVETLNSNPGIYLVFGSLLAGPHNPSLALVPEFRPVAFSRQKGGWAFIRRGGAGANLAIRQSALEMVGLFDACFGPGSRFPSCEEFDLYCRVLWAGFSAAFDPTNAVTHFGARSIADGSARRLMQGYAFGEGAVLGKHLRKGNLRAGAAILVIAARYTSYSLKSAVRGRTRGAARPFDFLRGAATAFWEVRPEHSF